MEKTKMKEVAPENTEQLHDETIFMETYGIDGFYDPFAETEKPLETIIYE